VTRPFADAHRLALQARRTLKRASDAALFDAGDDDLRFKVRSRLTRALQEIDDLDHEILNAMRGGR
jgi:hypothetical protein